jgi:hypothetical protein
MNLCAMSGDLYQAAAAPTRRVLHIYIPDSPNPNTRMVSTLILYNS